MTQRQEPASPEQARFNRWTWPLSVGAAVGAAIGYLYFSPQDTAGSLLGVGLLLGIFMTALVGILGAAAIELLVQGPGEPGRRRLGAFVFFAGRGHAVVALAAAGIMALATLRFGPVKAAFGAMFGLLAAWAFVPVPLVILRARAVSGDRAPLSRDWWHSAAPIRFAAVVAILAAGVVLMLALGGGENRHPTSPSFGSPTLIPPPSFSLPSYPNRSFAIPSFAIPSFAIPGFAT